LELSMLLSFGLLFNFSLFLRYWFYTFYVSIPHFFMSFSRHFRDILQSMSYASRSHRGRFRRMTVAFYLYFPFAKVMAFLSTFCDILPHSPQSPLKLLPPSGYPKVNPEHHSNGNNRAPQSKPGVKCPQSILKKYSAALKARPLNCRALPGL
jgi:hypothetical protein